MPPAASCCRYLVLTLLAACSPVLNWREVSIPEMRMRAVFPCKPQRHVQGATGLVHCKAGGTRFVLGWRPLDAAVGEEAGERAVLAQLERRMKATARRQHIGGLVWRSTNGEPATLHFLRATDGNAAWVRLWVAGGVLHQALVVGQDQANQREAAVEFLASLRGSD